MKHKAPAPGSKGGYMPVTFEEVQQHKSFMVLMIWKPRQQKYRRLLSSDALFFVDHHDFLRSSLTGEIFRNQP